MSTAHVFVSIGLCEIVSVLKEKANHKKAYSVRVHVAFHVTNYMAYSCAHAYL